MSERSEYSRVVNNDEDDYLSHRGFGYNMDEYNRGEESKYQPPRFRNEDGTVISNKSVGAHIGGDPLSAHSVLERISQKHNDPAISELANSIRAKIALDQAYHDTLKRD